MQSQLYRHQLEGGFGEFNFREIDKIRMDELGHGPVGVFFRGEIEVDNGFVLGNPEPGFTAARLIQLFIVQLALGEQQVAHILFAGLRSHWIGTSMALLARKSSVNFLPAASVRVKAPGVISLIA